MSISELISTLKEGQIAKASFGEQVWYVTKSLGFIRYCSADRVHIGDVVKLTKSNIEAIYEIIV
jgi:hypothetical protein